MNLWDLLTSEQKNELGMVRTAAIDIWHSPQHRHYTDHKPETHSERIIKKLSAMAGSMDNPLSSDETFILLSAAYLHDIGMQKRESGMSLDEVRDRHHLLSREMIIGSISEPDKHPRLNLRSNFADEIALVSAAHRKLDLASSEFNDRHKGDEILRVRLLSAMLRLADELDLDYNRVIMTNLALEDVNQISRLHWWRCHYVEGVVIQDGNVLADCTVPSEDYRYYIETSLESQLRQEVDKMRTFLWPQIKLAVGKVTVRISPTKRSMSDDDFAIFRAQVVADLERISSQTNAQIDEMRRFEERAAHQAAREGERQSGADPPLALMHLQRSANLFYQVGQSSAAEAQLVKMALIHERLGDLFESAQIYEFLGTAHLLTGRSFDAKWAFAKSIEQTPNVDVVCNRTANTQSPTENQLIHFRRSLLCCQARCFQGEFSEVDDYLTRIEAFLNGQTTPLTLLQLFCYTRMIYYGLLNDWKSAFGWASHMEQLAEQQHLPVPGGTYQVSMIAALAGENDIAKQWIQNAFDAQRNALELDQPAAAALFSRRGYLHWRAGEFRASYRDFLKALKIAEGMNDDLATVIQFNNAFIVASEINSNPYKYSSLKRLRSKISDMSRNYAQERGLLNDESDHHVVDDLSVYLTSLMRGLERNDLFAVQNAQKNLSSLYGKSGRPHESVIYLIDAGDFKNMKAAINPLLKKEERELDNFVSNVMASHPSNTPYDSLQAVCLLIAECADFLSENTISAITTRLIGAAKIDSSSSSLRVTVLDTLNKLAPQMSQGEFNDTGYLALDCITDPLGSDYVVREAAAKLISSQALAKRTYFSHELCQNLVERLIEVLDESIVGPQALNALMHIESDPASVNQKIVDKIREVVTHRAVDLRQIIAIQCYVIGEFGPISDDLARCVLRYFAKQVKQEIQMADEKHFNLSASILSLSALKQYGPLMKPGILPSEEWKEFFENILKLVQHPENIIAFREAALFAISHLTEEIEKLQAGNEIPRDFLRRTAEKAFEIAKEPQVSPTQDQLIRGAKDEFSRFHFNLGTLHGFQAVGLRSLGRLCRTLDRAEISFYFEFIVVQTGSEKPEIRDGAALALREVSSVLNVEERQTALMQLYVLLHDPGTNVCHTAIYALDVYLIDCSVLLADLICRRLIAILSTGEVNLRWNCAYLLQRLLSHEVFTSHRAEIEGALRLLRKDPSARLRHKDWATT